MWVFRLAREPPSPNVLQTKRVGRLLIVDEDAQGHSQRPMVFGPPASSSQLCLSVSPTRAAPTQTGRRVGRLVAGWGPAQPCVWPGEDQPARVHEWQLRIASAYRFRFRSDAPREVFNSTRGSAVRSSFLATRSVRCKSWCARSHCASLGVFARRECLASCLFEDQCPLDFRLRTHSAVGREQNRTDVRRAVKSVAAALPQAPRPKYLDSCQPTAPTSTYVRAATSPQHRVPPCRQPLG